MKANLIKVKVDVKDAKSIPGVLPYGKLLQGSPVELELNKKEIQRCMNFADVYDLSSGEEVLIDEKAFAELVEFVNEESVEETEPEVTEEDQKDPDPVPPVVPETPEQNNENPNGENPNGENPDGENPDDEKDPE